MNGRCWRCRAAVDTNASTLCPICHALEVAKVHAGEGMPMGCMSSSKEYESQRLYGFREDVSPAFLHQRFPRGKARNGRVIRKGNHLS